MKGIHFLVIFIILALATFIASAYDPGPLQDFCVAVDDPSRALLVNGKFCKNPNLVDVDDFFTSGLNIPGNTINRVGSNVTNVNVDRIPGINTLGVSYARIDFAPLGQNPPHLHPRASEVLAVATGKLLVGFVTSNQDGNRLFARILNQGDVFVFPIGLIHFQYNMGRTPALAFAVLSSQNPGTITIGNAIFGSKPPINPEMLAKAFQIEKNTVSFLQKQSWDDNS